MVSFKRAWKESDHPRVKSGKDGGQFTDVPGKNAVSKAELDNRAAAFFAEQKAKKKAAGGTGGGTVAQAAPPKKSGAFDKLKIGVKKAAPPAANPPAVQAPPVKATPAVKRAAAKPEVLPKKKAAPAKKVTPAKKAAPVKQATPRKVAAQAVAPAPAAPKRTRSHPEPVKVPGGTEFTVPADIPRDKTYAGSGKGGAKDMAYWVVGNVGPDGAEARQKRMLKRQPWTDAQRDALRTYTGDDYKPMNDALRKSGGKSGDPRIDAAIRDARAAMRPTDDGVTVFRAMGSGSAFGFQKNRKITKDQLEALVGRTWSDPAFTSTATRPGGYGHGLRVQAQISVPPGVRGAYVDKISQNEGEDEFILDAGTHFKITRYVMGPRGTVTLFMDVVRQDD